MNFSVGVEDLQCTRSLIILILNDYYKHFISLEENMGMIVTPFERNIEVWRQLWRVLERSDVVVQIVDARNPLFFYCQDLDQYVNELDPSKKRVLLINKADFLTDSQRQQWSDYLTSRSVRFVFFSASRANEELEKSNSAEEVEEETLLTNSMKQQSLDDDAISNSINVLSCPELYDYLESFLGGRG